MAKRKIIITEELKNVLNQIDNKLSNMILEDVEDQYLVDPDKYVNYLDISHSNKGHLSYLTKDRITKIVESEDKDFWKVKMRYHGRPSSVLKRLFKSDLSIWFEDFSMKYISIVDKPEYHMELVKGDKIAEYYNYKNYYNTNGNLGGSCMARVPSYFFDFYVKNDDRINMLVMLDQHDKVMGRSIVWIGDDFKIMDRIYTCNDLYFSYFYNWAIENNVICKKENNYRTPMHMMNPSNKENFLKKFSIDLKEVSFDKYPYLDTFKWLDINSKKLYNYIPQDMKKEDTIVLCDSMGGHLRSDVFGFDDITNQMYSSTDIVYLNYIDKNVYCGNTVFSKIYDCIILNDDSKYLKDINDYIFNEKYDHLNNIDKIEEAKTKKILAKEEESKMDWWHVPTRCAQVIEEVDAERDQNRDVIEEVDVEKDQVRIEVEWETPINGIQ